MRLLMAGFSLLSFSFVTACDNDTDQYSGLSELVAQRNEVRKQISGENALRKKNRKAGVQDDNAQPGAAGATKEISTIVLYEKSIDILDAESRLPLARGIAYLNRSGQIVRIKIINTK